MPSRSRYSRANSVASIAASRNVMSKMRVMPLISYVPPKNLPARTRFSDQAVTMKPMSASGANASRRFGANAASSISSIPATHRMTSGRIALSQPASMMGWRVIAPHPAYGHPLPMGEGLVARSLSLWERVPRSGG